MIREFKCKSVKAIYFDGTEESIEQIKKYLFYEDIDFIYPDNKYIGLYDYFYKCYNSVNKDHWIVRAPDNINDCFILSDKEMKEQYEEITEDIPPKEYELVGYLSDTNEFISAMFYDEVTDPLNSQWMYYKDYYSTPVYKQKG